MVTEQQLERYADVITTVGLPADHRWQQRPAAGPNSSHVHVDLVVGSHAVDITGLTADRSEELLVSGGEWAFDPTGP